MKYKKTKGENLFKQKKERKNERKLRTQIPDFTD